MTITTDAESTEDVNDFLLRIRELGEKRDKEDEERTRKLEEEILQGRKERQARRAERARSISPTKDSPILDPARLSISSLSQRAIDPPEQLSPTPRTPEHVSSTKSDLIRDDESIATDGDLGGSKPDGSEMGTSSRPTSPVARSRTGTLSWQQRPSSRDLSGNRSFFPASPTRSPTRLNRLSALSNFSNDDLKLSRSPLTLSPSAKDVSPAHPTPLEETADSTVEETVEENTDTGKSVLEPSHTDHKDIDMDQEEAPDAGKQHTPVDIGEERSRSPSRASSTFGDSSLGQRYSSVSSVSTATGLGSPIPLSSAQKIEPDPITSPSSPRRLSPERPASPTKGLGGFVQSAMMKRSDSVSKRWSAQLPAGLNRGSSFVNNRNSIAAPSYSDMYSGASPRFGREDSSLASKRPSSSHSEATIVHTAKEDERPSTPPNPSNNTRTDEGAGRPILHMRTSSTLSRNDQDSETSPAVSRTMDQRRWSRTKSTWLESALNRPDSPRHKRQQSQQSPSWKDRQSRGSVDLGRVNSFKEVATVGLMRTTAPGSHFKSLSVSGIPDLPTKLDTSNTSKAKEPQEESTPKSEDLEPKPADASPAISPTKEQKGEEGEPEAKSEDVPARKRAPTLLTPTTKKDISVSLPSPRDPLLNRPKVQSPVVDSRANLRKREVVKDDAPQKEPEFKNVFGKLKKAEASNYVAPDQLKENILKGKAALNATGGPKKTQRVDDLKESILKQKEAMKSSGGSQRRNTVGEDDVPVKSIPEAIAKRHNLSKSSSIRSNPSIDGLPSPSSQESTAPQDFENRPRSFVSSPVVEASQDIQSPQIAAAIPEPGEAEDAVTSPTSFPVNSEEGGKTNGDGQGNESKTSTAVPLEMGDPEEEADKPVRALPSETVAEVAETPAATEGLAKGKLAGRINPALAGLLSRGPPMSSEGSNKPISARSTPGNDLESPDSQSAAPLTHMTKNRARGPKRRLPKTVTVESIPSPVKDEIFAPKHDEPSANESNELNLSPIVSQAPVKVSSGWPLPDTESTPVETSEMILPRLAFSPPERPVEFKRSIPRLMERKVEQNSDKRASQVSMDSKISPSPPNDLEDIENLGDSPSRRPSLPPKPTIAPSFPVEGLTRRSPAQYSSPSPSPSPLRTNFRENRIQSPLATPQKTAPGGSIDLSRRDKALPSPPVPSKGPLSPADQQSLSTRSTRSSVSLVPQAEESHEIISSFFRTLPNSNDRVNIDTQLMLTTPRGDGRIRTLRKQLWEITGDGKRQDLPVNQEYILYEGSMYLCVHVFESDGMARIETHLWCGDDVGDAAIDDAQPFSRKVARENGCKLEIIRQGKETARFIQALGGILITRRGANSRSSSSAIFMLCGRKHLGQMVFDEVDFSRSSLCSGFSFVISATFGKLYLWKGKGSTAEEIGAARLIGMDLGLTGEFEEVAEGDELESFFEIFSYPREVDDYMRSDYWQQRPNHDRYRLRLFRVDHELGQRTGFWLRRRSGSSSPVIRPNDTVQEIVPFRQKDITAKGIYVLDTYFEIYVVVGEQASQRPAEFASAVVFAHEYGILAASLQDRPFIPNSLVSIGGLPESCRSAFRKWDKRSGSVQPRVFPLNAAIESIRS